MVSLAWCVLSALLVHGTARSDADAAERRTANAFRVAGRLLLPQAATSLEDCRQQASKLWEQAGYAGAVEDSKAVDSMLRQDLSLQLLSVETVPRSELGERALLPRFLAFCQEPEHAANAADVMLVDLRKAKESLPLGITVKLFKLGLLYTKTFSDDRRAGPTAKTGYATGSWQARFGTTDWSRAVSIARQDHGLGGPAGTRLERNSDGEAELHWQASATALVAEVEEVEKQVLVNALLAFRGNGRKPLRVRWGNGAEISDAEWAAYEVAMNVSKSRVPLLPGDLLLLDNFRYAHARWQGDYEQFGSPILMSKFQDRGVKLSMKPPSGRTRIYSYAEL